MPLVKVPLRDGRSAVHAVRELVRVAFGVAAREKHAVERLGGDVEESGLGGVGPTHAAGSAGDLDRERPIERDGDGVRGDRRRVLSDEASWRPRGMHRGMHRRRSRR